MVFFQHAFTPVSEADKAANNTGPGTFHMMEHFVACESVWLLTTFFHVIYFENEWESVADVKGAADIK